MSLSEFFVLYFVGAAWFFVVSATSSALCGGKPLNWKRFLGAAIWPITVSAVVFSSVIHAHYIRSIGPDGATLDWLKGRWDAKLDKLEKELADSE